MQHWKEYQTGKTTYSFRKLKGKQKVRYECADIFTFDIETTSFYVNTAGEVHAYDKTKTDDYYLECEKGALCYIWQFGINDTVYYGRDLSEFPQLLALINIDISIVHPEGVLKFCYVHNLAFEFQFVREYMDITDSFFREERKPLKLTANGFEFRCSYMLTRLSLATWGDSIGLYKLSGAAFNYDLLRTPLTPLSDYEMQYAERDCIVVYEGIKKYIEKYGNIKSIPLTQTGEIRKVIKDMYVKNRTYLKRITNLLPRKDEYQLLRAVFQGGLTGAYVYNAKRIIENVHSLDEASAYPFFMFTQKFPCSHFVRYNGSWSAKEFDTYAFIFLIKLKYVRPRTHLSVWSKSHCISVKNGVYNNGKIYSADSILLLATEQDLQALYSSYHFTPEVLQVYRAYKNYLDLKFVKYIAQLFRDKTTLDFAEKTKEQEDIYLTSKQHINSLYGMSVTDILQTSCIYDPDSPDLFIKEIPDYNEVIEKKRKRIESNFITYSTGVWVTSYARRRLAGALMECAKNNDLVYFDTDSCKFLNYEAHKDYFERENEKAVQLLKETCARANIPLDWVIATKPNGKVKILGTWEREKSYDKFVTLGSKKYCYIQDGKIGITVAGVPKSYAKWMQNIEDFKEGFTFERDAVILNEEGIEEKIAKNTLFYIDGKNPRITFADGYTVENKNGINLKATPYVLGITHDYRLLLERVQELERKGL